MNKQIKLNEEEFQTLIEESVMRVLNEGVNEENMDEGLWNNIKAGVKGAYDTFTKGGGFNAQYNKNLKNYAAKDIQNLKSKYGVNDGQNRNQYVKQATQQEVAMIKQKYQAKMQQLQQQMQAEIMRAQQKAGEKFQSYKQKKGVMDKEKKSAQSRFNRFKNADPYAE